MPATTEPGPASASPQQIGHYQVIAKIGEGGMGVVYRAHDTKLNRDVAIKVLPREFAEDHYRMARFEREAQLLASLNHPKISAIYGLEESGPMRALVMELVEGPTLAERIGRTTASARPRTGSASPAQSSAAASGSGSAEKLHSTSRVHKAALPLDEALPIAQQVAEALEYAHEHGIIHRDLKPANIKVTPDGCVKVLDFGLAKAMARDEASGDASDSPTLSLAMSEAGFIMGTAAYMAPEQAKGKPVDRRADIWAFGCVLYEMLTGHKAFEGETVSDVIASVIKSDPDWAALPETTPPAIQLLLHRCLAKDPKQRLQAIGDARIAIEENLSGADAEGSGARIAEAKRSSFLHRALPWALGVIAIVFVGITAWLALQPAPRQNVIRFSVPQPDINGSMMMLSPDGRALAFVSQITPGGPGVIWLRPLDSLTAQPISGTEGAVGPFWSPDSQQIGFNSGGVLKKVAVSGGAPMVLCDAKSFYGGTWNRDGLIVFSNHGSLYSIPDAGGTPSLVLAPDSAHQESFDFPQFLPDGRHFLFESYEPGGTVNLIEAGSLNSKTVVKLLQFNSQAGYVSPGYLLYLDQTTLMARPFDADALRFTGPAVPVAQGIGERLSGLGLGNFSASQTGVLAYGNVSNTIEDTPGQMTWFDRTGKKLGTVGEPAIHSTPALSPDGTRLATAMGNSTSQDIWIDDLKRGTASRLTFNPANDTNPVWSPDGSRIFFSSTRKGPYAIYQKPADGLGTTQIVFQSKNQPAAINDVSADGRYIIYDTAANPNSVQLWVLPLFGDRKPFVFVQGSYGASSAKFSPDGHYVAYASSETGKQEVYVQTFPQHTGKWQVSTSGGSQPMWRRDGKELFYLAPGDEPSETKIMSVAISSGPAGFQAGIPKELFQTQVVPLWAWRNSYVPSPDGQKFLLIAPASQTKPAPTTVVVNWPSLLKK